MTDQWSEAVDRAEAALLKAETASGETDALFEAAAREAETLIRLRPDAATGHHVLALAWYGRADGTENRNGTISRALARAHELEPENQFVMASLVYHAFDRGLYEEAGSWLAKIDDDFFRDQDQHWRALKHDELRICVAARLGKIANVGGFVATFLATDPFNRPVPRELVVTMSELARSNRVDRETVKAFLPLFDAEECRGFSKQQQELELFVGNNV